MSKYIEKKSKYLELISGKNRFLDFLIDKYNEDPKEGKRNFILSYLSKCSFFLDHSSFNNNYLILYTYINDSKDFQEECLDKIIKRCKNYKLFTIWSLNRCFDFSLEEYEMVNKSYYISAFDEPWIDGNYDLSNPYVFRSILVENEFVNNSTRCAEIDEEIIPSDNFLNLDIKPGELAFIGGVPSIGQTSVTISFLLNKIKNGGKVVYLTLQNTASCVGQKVLGSKAQVPIDNMRNNNFTNSQYNRIVDNIKQLDNIEIIECNHYNIEELKFLVNHHCDEETTIIIDGFASVHYEYDYPKCDEEVEYIVKELKNLAKEYNVAILTLIDLSKSIMDREDKKPSLDDFGVIIPNIKDIADKIYGIHRETFYIEDKFNNKRTMLKGFMIVNTNEAIEDTQPSNVLRYIEIIDIKHNKVITCNYNVLTESVVTK